MRVAILVEGRTDREAIAVILDRFASSLGVRIPTRFLEFGGGQGLLDVSRVVNSVAAQKQLNRDLVAAIVCKDRDCKSDAEFAEMTNRVNRELGLADCPVPITYHYVRYELESWLAADENAWERKFPKAGPHVLPHSILENCDPKGALRAHLQARGTDFRYTDHDKAIAAEIDVARAASSCPNLGEFLAKVAGAAGLGGPR